MQKKCFFFLFSFIFFTLGLQTPPKIPMVNTTKISMEEMVNNIVDDMKTKDQDPCYKDLQTYTNKFLGNRSIFYLFLYSARGINELGDYKNCKKNNGKYVILDLKYGQMALLTVGGCLPLECNAEYLQQYKAPILEYLKNKTNITLNLTADIYNPTERNMENAEITFGTLITFLFFGIVILIAIGVLVNEYIETKGQKLDDTHEDVGYEPINPDDSLCKKIMESFNFGRNSRSLFYGENKVDKNLDVLNGLRVLAMAWIIFGHSIIELLVAPVYNMQDVPKRFKEDRSLTFFTSATYSVDVFFMLSGFLAILSCHSAFKNPKHRTVGSVLKMYVLRYIRLLPIYVVSLLMVMYIMPLLYDGPIYTRITSLQVNCASYWYQNLLYINNFADMYKMCLSWTWYLTNDFQFFLLAPLFSLAYYWNKSYAYLSLLAIAGISFITQSIIFVANDMTANILNSDYALQQKMFESFYMKPYCRINPYLIGVFVAWMYISYKNKEEESVFKEFSTRIIESRLFRYFLYIIGIALIITIAYIYPDFYNGDDKDTHKIIALHLLYTILGRPFFVIGILCIIYPALLGKCRASVLLSNEVWSPLAKSTYCAYMIHLIVFSFYIFTLEEGMYFTIHKVLLNACDVMVITYLISLVITLLFESPVVQMSKYLLMPPKKKVEETPTDGGINK